MQDGARIFNTCYVEKYTRSAQAIGDGVSVLEENHRRRIAKAGMDALVSLARFHYGDKKEVRSEYNNEIKEYGLDTKKLHDQMKKDIMHIVKERRGITNSKVIASYQRKLDKFPEPSYFYEFKNHYALCEAKEIAKVYANYTQIESVWKVYEDAMDVKKTALERKREEYAFFAEYARFYALFHKMKEIEK